MSESTPTPEAGSEAPGLFSVVSAIARDLASAEKRSPGDLAELRRLRPEEPGGAVFFKICAKHLEPILPRGGEARDEAERRWAMILWAMAKLTGLHAREHSLGRAMAEAEVAETRVTRLLRARGEALFDALRSIVHLLVSKAEGVSFAELARFVLSEGRSDEESVRRSVARDFYRHEKKN